MIRWLHISDLHIQNRADWSSFRKELLRKCEEIGKIDLVIVTGDFHNFVEGHDFEFAKSFVKELIQECHLDINKDLFLIPGNHDGVTDIPDKKMCISAAKYTPLVIEKTWIEKLLDMFQDYETFVKELIPEYPVEHPAKIHNRYGEIKLILYIVILQSLQMVKIKTISYWMWTNWQRQTILMIIPILCWYITILMICRKMYKIG